MTFNAKAFINYEISDIESCYGTTMSPKERLEYNSVANKIQKLYDTKNIEGLEKIANNNELYTTAMQRCADEALGDILIDECGSNPINILKNRG